MSLFIKLFGTYSERQLKRNAPTVPSAHHII